jgi:hypothetical protein
MERQKMRLALLEKQTLLAVMRSLFFLLAFTVAARAGNFNDVVLQQVAAIPEGGGYATTTRAHEALAAAVRIEYVRFWSSNKPGGYAEKSVPRSKIARAIFSRLEKPDNISGMAALPRRDPYLAGLLTKNSSFAEAGRMCGIR